MARVGRWLLAIMVLVCIAGGAFYLGHSTAPGAKQAASVAPVPTSHSRQRQVPHPTPTPTALLSSASATASATGTPRPSESGLSTASAIYPSATIFLLPATVAGGQPHRARSASGWIGSIVGGGGPMSDDEGAALIGIHPHRYDGLYVLHYAVSGPMKVIYDVFVFPSPRVAREGRAWIDDNHIGSGVLTPPNPHPIASGEDLFAARDTSQRDSPHVSPYTLLTYRNLIFSAEVTSNNRAYYTPGIKRVQAIDAGLISATDRYLATHPHGIEPTPVASATPWPTSIPTPTTQPYTPYGVHICDDDHYSSKDAACRTNTSEVADLFMYHLAYTGKDGNVFTHATVRVVVGGTRRDGSKIADQSYADSAGTQYASTGEGLQGVFGQARVGTDEGAHYTISVYDGQTLLGSISFTYTGLTVPYTAPATPTPVPTPIPVSPLHVCTFSHFDQTNVQCLQDDSSLSLTDNTAVIVFPDATGLSNDGANTPKYVSGLNILRQDGTGQWVIVATQNMDVGVVDNFGGPGVHRIFETVSHLDFNATGVGSALFSPNCGDQVEYQLLDGDRRPISAAPITFTCG